MVAVSPVYLPEGRLLSTARNQEACASLEGLKEAMESGRILEGRALLCQSNHDLVVSLGPFRGVVPREEAALGIAEGTTRDIAILSRVGKPVAVRVTGLEEGPEGPVVALSRRQVQQQALEHILGRWLPGDVVSVTVTHLEPFGAFVDVACGIPSMLSLEQISVSRIPHPACRLQVGQEILAAVTQVDGALSRVSLSHKVLQGTWPENAALFSPGMTVPGVVRGIKPYGAFVELTPNLSGLADPFPGLREGDRVSVYIKAIQPQRAKIKLNIIDILPPEEAVSPPRYFLTAGPLTAWRYLAEDCARVSRDNEFHFYR